MSTAPTIARNTKAAPPITGRAPGGALDKRARLVFAYGNTVSDYVLTSASLENPAAQPHLLDDRNSEKA